jgi:hypothetical protein
MTTLRNMTIKLKSLHAEHVLITILTLTHTLTTHSSTQALKHSLTHMTKSVPLSVLLSKVAVFANDPNEILPLTSTCKKWYAERKKLLIDWIISEFPLLTFEQVALLRQQSFTDIYKRKHVLERLIKLQISHGMWLLHDEWFADAINMTICAFVRAVVTHNFQNRLLSLPWFHAGVMMEIFNCHDDPTYHPTELYGEWNQLCDKLLADDMVPQTLDEQDQCLDALFSIVEWLQELDRPMPWSTLGINVQYLFDSYVLFMIFLCLKMDQSILFYNRMLYDDINRYVQNMRIKYTRILQFSSDTNARDVLTYIDNVTPRLEKVGTIYYPQASGFPSFMCLELGPIDDDF